MNHRGRGRPGCPSQMGRPGRKAPGTLTEDLVGVVEGASLALPEREFPTVMGTVPTTYTAFFHGGRQDRPQSHFTSPVEKCPQQLIQAAAPRLELSSSPLTLHSSRTSRFMEARESGAAREAQSTSLIPRKEAPPSIWGLSVPQHSLGRQTRQGWATPFHRDGN